MGSAVQGSALPGGWRECLLGGSGPLDVFSWILNKK